MNTRICTISLSLLAGACALALPAVSHAGNVGYHLKCSNEAGDPSAAITLAGHTPIPVTVLDSASLAPLDALIIETCQDEVPANPALDSAISNGMRLFYEVIPNSTTPPPIPGLSGLSFAMVGCGLDVEPAAGSPISTGPGGTITSSTLDAIQSCTYRGEASPSSLPAGSTKFLTGASPNDVFAFGYNVGQTRVAFSMSQYFAQLPGGIHSSYPDAIAGGAKIYYTNVITWLMGDEAPATLSCAEQGYKGMQLVWCKNICEKGYTGQKLQTWLHRWFNQYHTEPACMMEGDEGGEGGNDF